MKKIIKILLICLIIAGTIVTATIGLNVGLKYSANTQISINIGQEFEIKDIKEITNEVFGNKSVMIQKIELYKDMVQITVKEATDEQIESLSTKINEKYDIDNEAEVINNPNVKLRTLIKPYIIPVAIVSLIVILICMVVFRKIGIWKVIYVTALNMVAPQAILVSIYAVTRLPINRLTAVIAIVVYAVSITLNMVYLNSIKKSKNN